MLLVPLDRKIDWKRPPAITFLLILLNCLVFFGFQAADHAHEKAALRYFVESSLPAIEGPLYLTHLEKTGRSADAERLRAQFEKKRGQLPRLMFAMEIDARFMQALRSGQLVPLNDPRHQLWQKERARLDELLARSFIHRYSLRPAYAEPFTFFSHMFLHASIGHLLGNMIFLALVGYAVEATLGSWRYLLAYLLAGLAAAGLDIPFHQGSAVYSLGASGAIAGVMGLYAVLFGLRKIRFFYWVVFYFDYVRAPAIIMLPLWLGKECYELLFGGPSNINYLAHIGGLLAGAGMAAALARCRNAVNRDYLDENDKAEDYRRRFGEGIRSLAALDVARAERIFRELHEVYPEDRQLLIQRYNIAKLAPASANYHAMAHRILELTDETPETLRLQHVTYLEYVKIAQPAFRLPAALLPVLARRLAAGGFLNDAEKLVEALLKRSSTPLAPALLALGCALAKCKQSGKSRFYLELLTTRHAQSPEAEHARQLLKQMAQT